MTGANMAAAGAASAAAAAIRALKSWGVVVAVEPGQFLEILRRVERPLIVCWKGGIFRTKYRFATSYRGFVFSTETTNLLNLPDGAELVLANKMWLPEF